MVAARYLTYLYHYSSEIIHSQENLSMSLVTTDPQMCTTEVRDYFKLVSYQ